MTDAQYIEAIKENDQRAISKLYNDCYNIFFNTIRQLPFQMKRDYIRDLYHDAIVVVVDKVQNRDFEIKNDLRNYIIGIGKYKCLSDNRKKMAANKYTNEIAKLGFIADEPIDNEQVDIVDKLVKTMKEPCISLLKMFYWEGLSGKEIAEKGGYKNSDSVKSQKSKCMTTIKSHALEFVKLGLL